MEEPSSPASRNNIFFLFLKMTNLKTGTSNSNWNSKRAKRKKEGKEEKKMR